MGQLKMHSKVHSATNQSFAHDERSVSKDPYGKQPYTNAPGQQSKLTKTQKRRQGDPRQKQQNDVTSQKIGSNTSNLDDSMGIIGSSLSKVQVL